MDREQERYKQVIVGQEADRVLREFLESETKLEAQSRLLPDGTVHPYWAFKPYPKGTPECRMDQVDFNSSEAKTQGFLAANGTGKTHAGLFKVIAYAVGYDHNRPDWQPPIDTAREYLIWACCDPKKTRETLMDLWKRVPPGTKATVRTALGNEEIVFAPTALRPRGARIKVMSYGMGRHEFQRDAVHVIWFDEEPPEDIWIECEQRLVRTSGFLFLTLTPVLGTSWLHKKLNKIDTNDPESDPHYCAQSGAFAWFMADQRANPINKPEDIELRSKGMTEQERAIRIHGHYILMAGQSYFDAPSLEFIRNHDVLTPPKQVVFMSDGKAVVSDRVTFADAWSVWEEPVGGSTYAIGADIARGRMADFSAAFVYCVQTSEVVASFRCNEIDPMDFAAQLAHASKYYNNAIVGPEVNTDESGVLYVLEKSRVRLYQRESFSGKHNRVQKANGWETTSKSKHAAMKVLYLALRNRKENQPGGLILHDETTVDELRKFGYLNEKASETKRKKVYGLGALDGHDDTVMALAITLMVAQQAPKGKRRSGEGAFQTMWESFLKDVKRGEKMSGRYAPYNWN